MCPTCTTLFCSTDSDATVCDGRDDANENRKVAMTTMTFADDEETSKRDCVPSYRVIDTPHKHAEQRLVRAEQLNLLVLHPEVLLLQLAEPAGHQRCARHACPRLSIRAHCRRRRRRQGERLPKRIFFSRASHPRPEHGVLPSSARRNGEGWDKNAKDLLRCLVYIVIHPLRTGRARETPHQEEESSWRGGGAGWRDRSLPYELTAAERWHTPMSHDARGFSRYHLVDPARRRITEMHNGRMNERPSHARTHHLSRYLAALPRTLPPPSSFCHSATPHLARFGRPWVSPSMA